MDAQELAQKKARIKKNLKILQAIKAKWRPQKERFPIIYQGFKAQEQNLVDQYNELKKAEKGSAGPKKEKEKAPVEKKDSKKEEPKKEEPKKEKITVPFEEDDDDFESDDEWNEMDMDIEEDGPAKKKEDAKKLPPVDTKADTISDEDALTLEKDDDEFESDDDDDDDDDWEEMDAEEEKEVAAEKEDSADKSSKKKLPFAKGTKPPSKPILKKGADPKGSADKDKLKALAKGLKKRTKK